MIDKKSTLNIRAYGYTQFELTIKDNNDNDFLPMLIWDFIDWEYKNNKEPARFVTSINSDKKYIRTEATEKFMLDFVNGKLINRDTNIKDEFLYRAYNTDQTEVGNYYSRELLLEFIDNDHEIFEKYNDIHIKFRMLNIDKILNDFSMNPEILNKLSIKKFLKIFEEDK